MGPPEGWRRQPPTFLPRLPRPSHQAQGRRALAFAQGRGSNGGDFDVLAVGPVLQPLDDLEEVELGDPAHGDDFVLLQAQPSPASRAGVGMFALGRFGDLPILHLSRVVRHCALAFQIGSVLFVPARTARRGPREPPAAGSKASISPLNVFCCDCELNSLKLKGLALGRADPPVRGRPPAGLRGGGRTPKERVRGDPRGPKGVRPTAPQAGAATEYYLDWVVGASLPGMSASTYPITAMAARFLRKSSKSTLSSVSASLWCQSK